MSSASILRSRRERTARIPSFCAFTKSSAVRRGNNPRTLSTTVLRQSQICSLKRVSCSLASSSISNSCLLIVSGSLQHLARASCPPHSEGVALRIGKQENHGDQAETDHES